MVYFLCYDTDVFSSSDELSCCACYAVYQRGPGLMKSEALYWDSCLNVDNTKLAFYTLVSWFSGRFSSISLVATGLLKKPAKTVVFTLRSTFFVADYPLSITKGGGINLTGGFRGTGTSTDWVI